IQGIPLISLLKLFRNFTVITNIGGFEWLRPKFNFFLKHYFKWCFNKTMIHSDEVILDNAYYKNFLPKRVRAKIRIMSYGGEIDWSLKLTNGLMEKYPFLKKPYYLSVGRALADNQLEELCRSFSRSDHTMVLISNFSSSHYGERVYRKYHHVPNLVLIDGLYDKPELDLIRRNCKAYIHTHTLCGTAPSLVEMIFARKPIISADRPQNRYTLAETGFYYTSFDQVQELLANHQNLDTYIPPQDLCDQYDWNAIVKAYEKTYRRVSRKRMKRVMDIILSLTGLVVVFPFMIPVVIILALTGEHYIFYLQPRIGKNGRKFNIMKFSTMLKDSPNIGTGDITVKNDPRIFPFGQFLRRTKINEIPQLINVLKGEMSLIGPRPMTPRIYEFYTPEEQSIISQLRPGLSGVGSIVFREESTIVENSQLSIEETFRQLLSPYKAALEKWYLENQSFGLDLKILFITILTLIFKDSNLIYKRLKDLPEMPEELKELSK
ncbi:MAG: sugar transferase, partial [Bacteroidales bacterium]|nr:sugar transferase [Bacteroidales bacterium]